MRHAVFVCMQVCIVERLAKVNCWWLRASLVADCVSTTRGLDKLRQRRIVTAATAAAAAAVRITHQLHVLKMMTTPYLAIQPKRYRTYDKGELIARRWDIMRPSVVLTCDWPSELKIGTPVTPGPGKTHTNYGFSTPFRLCVVRYTRRTDGQKDGRTRLVMRLIMTSA